MPSTARRKMARAWRAALEHLEPRRLLANTNILVVYNSAWTKDSDANGVQDSLQVANYYALKRGVPAANLLGVNTATTDALTYANYKTQVAQPVQDKLLQLGEDSITYILLVYGMPWKLSGDYSLDNALVSPELSLSRTGSFSVTNLYFESNPLYSSSGVYDAGATDKGHFSHSYTVYGSNTMYLVSRLDGPVDNVLGISRITNLVDQALYAEKYISKTPGFLNGTMYVASPYPPDYYPFPTTDNDIRTGYFGTYAGTEKNIGYAGRYAEQLGVPWVKLGAQNNNAFLYSGAMNYDYNINGRQYQWLPGGTGSDFNSYTLAYNIRTAVGNLAWGTEALLDGITGVLGVTAEPYTTGHPRPNVFTYYMLKGYTFGEAAALSKPHVGWMEIAIGDPLYAPYAPKTDVVDNVAPVFVAGYPQVDWTSREGYVVDVLLDDQANPEAATVKVEFGLTTVYGQTVELTQYYLHHRVPLSDLQAGQTYHVRVTVTDPLGNATVSPDFTFQTSAQTPYGGTAWPIAGTIQIENFDVGGEGIAYHDSEPQDAYTSNARPSDAVEVATFAPIYVWYIRAGEWLEYTVNVLQSGIYSLDVYSQSDVANNQFHFKVDGVNVSGAMSTPSTGSGSPYGIATKNGIALSAGTHVVRLCFDSVPGANGWFGRFDWFKFTLEPDTQFPTVSITSPNPADTVSGNVTVTADASDNIGVVGVQFKVDGNNIATEATSSPFEVIWDTTTLSNGSHSLTAVARDAAGNTTTSQAIIVTVDNGIPDPLGLTATPVSPNQINLSWNSYLGESGFLLERSPNGTDNWTLILSSIVPGDTDTSGFVNLTDLTTLAGHWQQPGTWRDGDFNNSGIIDLTDLTTLAGHWQAQKPPFGNPTSFQDTSLQPSLTYYYRLRAATPSGPTPYSATVQATTPTNLSLNLVEAFINPDVSSTTTLTGLDQLQPAAASALLSTSTAKKKSLESRAGNLAKRLRKLFIDGQSRNPVPDKQPAPGWSWRPC